jgi:hypothetical protein
LAQKFEPAVRLDRFQIERMGAHLPQTKKGALQKSQSGVQHATVSQEEAFPGDPHFLLDLPARPWCTIKETLSQNR